MTTSAIQHLREERHTMIGGSDLHHVFSLEPYGCARQLVYSKRPDQFTPDHTFHGNRYTERGSELEDMAAKLFMQQTGIQMRQVAGGLQGKARRDKDHPYIGVHADRELVGVEAGTIFDHTGTCINPDGGAGILSVKVPGEMMFKKIKRDGLPHSYVMQLQYELSVWQRQWGTYALLWADGWELIHFNVRRDDELIKQIVDGVHRVWGLVENGPLPERLDPDDSRCSRCPFRTQCQGAELIKQFEDSKDVDRELVAFLADPELVQLVEERDENKQLLAQAEEMVENINDQIKALLGEIQAADIEGYRLYNRFTAGRTSVQREPLKKYLQDLGRMADELIPHIEALDDRGNLAQLVTYLRSVATMPAVFEKKYTTVGKPFKTLKIYAR